MSKESLDINDLIGIIKSYRGRCPQPKEEPKRRGPQKYEVLFFHYKTH